MKTAAIVLVLVALVAVTAISGCTQQPDTTGTTGELTADQMEDEAYKAVEQEMDSLEDMTLEDLENELLT